MNIDEQLTEIRKEHGNKYTNHCNSKSNLKRIDVTLKTDNEILTNKRSINQWPDKTCVIVGDSMISGLDENRLSRKGKPIKV